MKRNVPITFSLPPEMVDRLDLAAQAEDRPRSSVARRALGEWLDRHTCPAKGAPTTTNTIGATRL